MRSSTQVPSEHLNDLSSGHYLIPLSISPHSLIESTQLLSQHLIYLGLQVTIDGQMAIDLANDPSGHNIISLL